MAILCFCPPESLENVLFRNSSISVTFKAKSILLAISFAAAAKYVTKSGAAYAYSKAAFGNNVGFYMGILRYFSASVAWGVMAVGVIKSTISIFGGNPNETMSVTIGFLILMAVITVINLFGQKVVKYVMNLATIGKLAALVLIIVAGVVLLIVSGASSNLSQVDQITQNGQKIVPTLTTTGFVMAIVSANSSGVAVSRRA